jgi:hypothetical protein
MGWFFSMRKPIMAVASGANKYSEPDLTHELAEGGAKPRQGQFRSSARVPKNETLRAVSSSLKDPSKY